MQILIEKQKKFSQQKWNSRKKKRELGNDHDCERDGLLCATLKTGTLSEQCVCWREGFNKQTDGSMSYFARFLTTHETACNQNTKTKDEENEKNEEEKLVERKIQREPEN